MSAFASFLGALGGPATAGALVAGGLIVGIVGGGVVAGAATGGAAGEAPAAGTLPVYPCPDAGPALASVQGGQRLLVTGRTEDGGWVRIHLPGTGRTEGWVQASPLTVKGDLASLPVAECQPELAIASPSVAPEPSLTAIVNATPTPTASPSPSPSPSPTAEPEDKAPTIASLRTTTSKISYDTGEYCPDAGTSVTFRVRAKDDAGVEGVKLYWRKPGASGFTPATMTRASGSATDGTWQVTLDTGGNGITTAGKLAYYAIATDTAGQTRRSPSRGSETITVAVCENTGPTITQAASSEGSKLAWDPLGVGRCQTATNITATVKDVDGVKSVTLFYRPPGSSSWLSKPMNNTTIKGKWFANLDTLGDKISIVDPPTDNLRWYIKAVDDKGKSSQSSTKTITITRCDTEAQFDGVFPQSTTYACTTSATITLGTYANDRDQGGDGLKVVFYWSLTNPRTQDGPITGKMAATISKGNYYQGTSSTFNGQRFYAGSLVAWVVTTDRYGGTTKSPVDGPYSMACR
jgi:hypothetical protein